MPDFSAFPASFQCAALPQWRVVRATGADAVSFLHGQLTQDVATLPPNEVRFGAYCNAKGRVQATVLFWLAPTHTAEQPDVLLLVHASLAETWVKRLRMFVLRAKVTLELTDLAVFGGWATSPATPALAPQQAQHHAEGQFTLLSATPLAEAPWRAWVVASATASLPAPQATAATWEAQELQAGVPWVTQATFELFTPQTVNLDLIQGVSFSKGCYPGQEVVARSHYRGKQKRRMFLASTPLTAAHGLEPGTLPGQDICSPQAREPLGRIVNAQQLGQQLYVLFEAPLTEVGQAELHLLSPEGLPLAQQALPYTIATDPG